MEIDDAEVPVRGVDAAQRCGHQVFVAEVQVCGKVVDGDPLHAVAFGELHEFSTIGHLDGVFGGDEFGIDSAGVLATHPGQLERCTRQRGSPLAVTGRYPNRNDMTWSGEILRDTDRVCQSSHCGCAIGRGNSGCDPGSSVDGNHHGRGLRRYRSCHMHELESETIGFRQSDAQESRGVSDGEGGVLDRCHGCRVDDGAFVDAVVDEHDAVAGRQRTRCCIDTVERAATAPDLDHDL
nr:hypothetical protein [Rhodococcus sp. JVH1]